LENEVSTLDIKKLRLSTGVKWALGLAAALLIAPVIFLVVKGLVGLALAAAVGLAIINFAPVLSMNFANWKLKAVKYAASVSPVETLQNVWNEKDQALKASLATITDFAAQVAGFDDKLDGFRAEFPGESAKFEATLRAMQALLAKRKQRYQESRDKLAEFAGEIRKADAIWKMGLAAQAMTRAAGMTEDDFMQRIKTETAYDSVQESLNRAMAELDASLLEEAPLAIENQPSQGMVIPINQAVGVAR
jgi:hypothetical protein